MFDFGDAVIMTCLHQPYSGKPIHVSRFVDQAGRDVDYAYQLPDYDSVRSGESSFEWMLAHIERSGDSNVPRNVPRGTI